MNSGFNPSTRLPISSTTRLQMSIVYPIGTPASPFAANGAWSATNPMWTIFVAAMRSSVCAAAPLAAIVMHVTAAKRTARMDRLNSAWLVGLDTVHQVALPVWTGLNRQPVNVALESREHPVVVTGEVKIADDRARLPREPLARHDQRNARRIWD